MQGWIGEYVQGLSTGEFRVQVGIALLILSYLLYRIYQTHHRYRYINDTATSRIASAAQGYVELKGLGELMPGSSITSPFSQRRCLWYQCIMEKRQQLNDDRDWEEVSCETSDELFHLQDETGVCVIIPDGAVVTPSLQRSWHGHSQEARHRDPQNRGRFSRFMGSGEYRFTERLILVADTLYVIGYFETRQNQVLPPSFNTQVEKLVEKWRSQPARYLSRFDKDGNGIIQPSEWVKVRQHAQQQVRQQQPMEIHHILRKPLERSRPFVISALSEETLLKKKRYSILFQLALFFLILYVSLIAVNLYPR